MSFSPPMLRHGKDMELAVGWPERRTEILPVPAGEDLPVEP